MLGSIGTSIRPSISITTATVSITRSVVTSFIILQIIYVEFVRQIIFVQAVVVERNLYTYYRLPTSVIKTSNATQSFYVLQCPFRTTLNIPKPQDMGICTIVGRYRETRAHRKAKNLQEGHVMNSSPVQLYTKVEYAEPLTNKKFIKIVKIKSGKPVAPIMQRPFKLMTTNMRDMLMEKPRVRLQNTKQKWEQHNDISHLKPIKYLDIKSSEEINIEKRNNSTSTIGASKLKKKEKEKTKSKNDKNKNDTKKENDIETSRNKPKPKEFSDEFDFDDEEDDDTSGFHFSEELQMDATNYSPLRLLNVKDAIEKLKLHVPSQHGDSFKNAEKFFAELNDYKRGFHTTNYHNIYHRDELYNDHIIYDDLYQAGNYNQNEKVQEKDQKDT